MEKSSSLLHLNHFYGGGGGPGPPLDSPLDPLSYVNYNINISSSSSIVVPEVSCIHVREIINSLNNSSPGHDELSPIVAKACMDGFIEPITYITNESLT